MRTIKNALANLVQTAILNFKMATTKYGYSPLRGSHILDFPLCKHLFYEKSNPIKTPIIVWHSMVYSSSGKYFIIDVSLVPLGHIRMWRVRLSWDSRVTGSRVSWGAPYRERRWLLSLRIVLWEITCKNLYLTTYVVSEIRSQSNCHITQRE